MKPASVCLLPPFLLVAGTAGAFECKLSSDCEPCIISGPDSDQATREWLRQTRNSCQPSHRQREAAAAACIGQGNACQPDYALAIELLEPLECVETQGTGDACDPLQDWANSLQEARELLTELRTTGTLELTLKDWAPDAAVTLRGPREVTCPSGENPCVLRRMPLGEYELAVRRAGKDVRNANVEIVASQVTKRDVSVPVESPVEIPVELTPPVTREPQAWGLWGAATFVGDENGSASFGMRGSLGVEWLLVGPLEGHLGVVVARRAGGLGGFGLFPINGEWRFGGVIEVVWVPLALGDSEAGGGLVGGHAGLQLGSYFSEDARWVFGFGIEQFAGAEPYDARFLVASLGAEWRPR